MGKSCATVRALTYCDLHKIHAEDIIEILEMYPEYARGFWNNLDLTFDLREVQMLSVLILITNHLYHRMITKTLSHLQGRIHY